MLSKVSVDEVFMHYFKTCRQFLGDLLQTPTGAPPLDPECYRMLIIVLLIIFVF